MKLLVTTAALVLFNAAAFAQDPPKNEYTIDEINSALAFRGQPPLYTSRVLHDDRSPAHETKYISTIVSTGDANGSSTVRSSSSRSR